MIGENRGLFNNLNSVNFSTNEILQQGLKENAYSSLNRCFHNH